MEPNSMSHYAATVVMLLTICAAAVLPTVVLPAATATEEEAEKNGKETDFVKTLEDDEGSLSTQEIEQYASNEAVVAREDKDNTMDNHNVKDKDNTMDNHNVKDKDNTMDRKNIIDLPKSVGDTPACGVVVKEDVTLYADLSCDGDGLLVGNNGITIDLNGHTIKYNRNHDAVDLSVNFGDDSGILVPKAKHVKIIGPGLITGFDRAITFTGSSGGEVSDLILRDNEVGVLASGSKYIGINANTIDNNKYAVVLESSLKGLVAFNLIAANEKQGIVLLNSDYYKILTNSIFGNGKNGIFLDAQSFDNSVDFNSVFVHKKADINNANGVPPNINQNNFGENNNCKVSLPDGLC
jgi:Periplasmic copper-binding protein (NosD)